MNGPPTNLPQKKSTSKDYVLAFTWAPAPYLQRNDPKDGYKVQLPVLRLLTRCCSQIKLHPELFVNGGLHYHAYLVINDSVKWFKQILPEFKYKGHVVVKTYRDDKWMDYITKSWDEVKSILDLTRPLDLALLKCRGKKMPEMPKTIKRGMEDFISVETSITADSGSDSTI